MITTVEVRWFFPVEPPERPAVFEGMPDPSIRTDWYHVSHEGSGVKLRDGNIDVKLLVHELGPRDMGGRRGRLEEWRKWIFEGNQAHKVDDSLLLSSGWVAVQKVRSLLVYDLADGEPRRARDRPEEGCQFEWTELTVGDDRWLTIGLEAFGEATELEHNLTVTALRVLPAIPSHLTLDEGVSYSYPKWLVSRSQYGAKN